MRPSEEGNRLQGSQVNKPGEESTHRICSIVLFPLPDGPMMTLTSPGVKVQLTRSRIVFEAPFDKGPIALFVHCRLRSFSSTVISSLATGMLTVDLDVEGFLGLTAPAAFCRPGW